MRAPVEHPSVMLEIAFPVPSPGQTSNVLCCPLSIRALSEWPALVSGLGVKSVGDEESRGQPPHNVVEQIRSTFFFALMPPPLSKRRACRAHYEVPSGHPSEHHLVQPHSAFLGFDDRARVMFNTML
ncbi:hypothetical protein PoB_004659400 [Plakobranchus ocellatus]|uniref:Uncharacterized protein n=1 Tax=Plakobranchus ocellatus TaxID=259542 RepID=A0AAV4BIZ3_9GAST|nr:hypothetical protein PoB_004659400 [Plakobranchus ocellatus]